jgi:hypothetical protein
MRIRVASEEDCLKEHYTSIPNRRCTSEDGQDHLGDHDLYPEEQKGADEQGQSIEECQPNTSSEGPVR